MASTRHVRQVLNSVPTLEGAGVRLRRAFGNRQGVDLDPFLLLDEFHSSNPADYQSGFPWHPHRGIETITYVLQGSVEHGDSLGNRGVIHPGDVQWMTAGGGIIHQEMPQGDAQECLWGFQLWANLPASDKMMPPRYQEILAAHIPVIDAGEGVSVHLVCGEYGGRQGPVQEIVTAPQYLDVHMPPGARFQHAVADGHTAFAYAYDGQGDFDGESGRTAGAGSLVVFEDHGSLTIRAGETGLRFLLVSGKPLRQPVAWYGPIVMNTEEEIRTALEEYRRGDFLKHTA